MDSPFHEVRRAVRSLVRSPLFSAVAVLTLALGVGAITTIFSVVNGVLLKPLPYPEAERIVRVAQVAPNGTLSNFSEPNFRDLQEQGRGFAALARTTSVISSVVGGSEPVRVPVSRVSGDFLEVMETAPLLGRGFAPEELVEGAGSVALVRHGFWERYLDSERDLSRLVLQVGDAPVPVVGILPADFDYPAGTEIWLPAETVASSTSRTAHNWQVVGRLAPGMSLEAARSNASAIAARLRAEHGDDTWMVDARLTPLPEQMVAQVRPALLILLGAAGVLFLIACANVTNLLLARSEARRRELGVRLALGAGPGRVIRHFLGETMVLAGVGGILGAVLAVWAVGALVRTQPGTLPRSGDVTVDARVLLFTVGLSLVTATGLGLLAAWRSLRESGGSLSGARSHAGSREGTRIRAGLVVTQVGLTMVLLVGGGLLARSFLRVTALDLGFDTGGVLTMTVALPSPTGAEDRPRLAGFHRDMLLRLEGLPGVRQVGGINALPMGGGGANGAFLKLARPDEVTDFDGFRALMADPARTGYAEYRVADAGFFRTLSIPLLEGRLFQESDGPDAPHVALVSRSLAEAEWPGESPLGKAIQFGNMDGDLRGFTVVGVVGDVREANVESDPRPTFYALLSQRPGFAASFTYVLATDGNPALAVAPARAALREYDPTVPPAFRTMEEVYARALAGRRFNLLLLGAFGGTALLLSLLGIYGVMAFGVAQRTREIGVRMALGAAADSVQRMVVIQALVLTAGGVALGLAAALLLSRLLDGFLFGVGRMDPVTFVVVPLLLLGASLLAAWLPARRASAVDPVVALGAD